MQSDCRSSVDLDAQNSDENAFCMISLGVYTFFFITLEPAKTQEQQLRNILQQATRSYSYDALNFARFFLEHLYI